MADPAQDLINLMNRVVGDAEKAIHTATDLAANATKEGASLGADTLKVAVETAQLLKDKVGELTKVVGSIGGKRTPGT